MLGGIFMAKKIVIDAGHGGEDPGTSANGIVEKDLTLKISEYLHKRFDELGIPNEMTRTSDVTLGPSERPTKAQSFYGNSNDVILLSNHINAGGGDGAEIIYSLRNSDKLSNLIAQEFAKAGQNVRKYYQRRLPSDPSKDYYYILRDTPNNESIIIEYGFADSTGDDPSLLKNNWEELAEAVVRAVASYVGVPYSSGSSSLNTHVVKSGDTLWSIAKKYGVSVEELKEKNNLTSNALSINQVLLIPGEDESSVEVPSSSEYYTVKAGDSLYAIANKYGMSVDELKDLNNLTSNLLTIGQRLRIKKGMNEENTGETYTVVKGDNLYQIALKFDTTVDALKTLNGLNNNVLSIGQVLKIPSSDNNEIIYTVVAGDNLYQIARRFGTTVTAIMNRNNLATNVLSVGQKLIIP